MLGEVLNNRELDCGLLGEVFNIRELDHGLLGEVSNNRELDHGLLGEYFNKRGLDCKLLEQATLMRECKLRKGVLVRLTAGCGGFCRWSEGDLPDKSLYQMTMVTVIILPGRTDMKEKGTCLELGTLQNRSRVEDERLPER